MSGAGDGRAAHLTLVEPDEAAPLVEAEGRILLSDPDVTAAELEAVEAVIRSPRISAGSVVDAFETAFAEMLGRRYAIAVPSGTIGLRLVLDACGIGPGDEVIASSFSWREAVHAIRLIGATPVFADIDYWSGTLAPNKVEPKITGKTRAVVAGNTNGHPAAWDDLAGLAAAHGLALIEDSTEAIGSRYKGRLVGTFGAASVFDFAQPAAVTCGEGGMVVTDDVDIAVTLRRHRARSLGERTSVVAGATPPLHAMMSDLTAALGLAQLRRLPEILAARKRVEDDYLGVMRSFEGIKPPYIAPDVTEVHWFLYLVHLGTRFPKSGRDAIIEDLATEEVEAAAYSSPLHLQRHYRDLGWNRGDLFVTEKVADRAIALPFHAHLDAAEIAFIVETMKDSSVNVGAGAAIY
ncbi:DegT/DnrJ/EryC1/StrS family aminotransferase [Acuticoccus sediminis]|uniref:DegT/DnrJ/EryC1/StrS family aminotransferase n=1 Tax=Acuticoccus sediminis TaxID=2184697 RepID=UPI001CFEE092|nr:DegT/DnrJ/EryC1/StrS family aminotransferase [Acuticoccus sediminis]